MITEIITQKEWNIPESLKRRFNEKTLKEILRSLNQIGGGNYFFVDYFHKKLIIHTSKSRILCGYPKEFVEKEGLAFINRIVDKNEKKWHKRLKRLVADVFFSLNKDERQNLALLYDMSVNTINGETLILHHNSVPFQLCKNGNLWLALVSVAPSSSKETWHNACIVNSTTQTRYDLIKNVFVSSKITPLTLDENNILLLLGKSMSESDICEELNMKKGKYHHIKNRLFEKLKVSTPGGAVHIAHHLGLI